MKRFNDDANNDRFALVLRRRSRPRELFGRYLPQGCQAFENEDDDENEYEGATYFTGPTES